MMVDGRHFESRFRSNLYTAADFELDERHVIKNEKVALDRLRVRQNVFLVTMVAATFVCQLYYGLPANGYNYRNENFKTDGQCRLMLL